MTIPTEESDTIFYEDRTPVEIVPGTDAYYGELRRVVNEALKPYGIALRFYWKSEDDGETWHVVHPPYAFFCKRTELDTDETKTFEELREMSQRAKEVEDHG